MFQSKIPYTFSSLYSTNLAVYLQIIINGRLFETFLYFCFSRIIKNHAKINCSIELKKPLGLAVKQLSEEKFTHNQPLMLDELNLIGEQFYYEYSNVKFSISVFQNQKQHQVKWLFVFRCDRRSA